MTKNKLTKWSDIIYYYKWHAVGVVVAIVVILMIVNGIANKVEDDVTINMLLSHDAMASASEEIATDLNSVIPDIDGDGIKQSYINIVTVPYEIKDETDMNAGMQASLVFAMKETLLCLIDKDLLDLYTDKDFFEDVSQKATAMGLKDDEVYKNPSGMPVGLSLKGNKYLEEKGVNTDTLYACFKLSSMEGSKEYAAIRKAAGDVLDFIIEQGK